MIEIVVLLSIIVTTIFVTGIAAAFGSENRHSGREDYYGGITFSPREKERG
ncbi:MAG: hypothetical protein ACXABV_15400 [Candidatus Thorarchaeota archaeon]